MKRLVTALALYLLAAAQAEAQGAASCRILCDPQLMAEPTITFTNLFESPRLEGDRGVARERRETEFELVMSLGVSTRIPWLDLTFEAIVMPFERDNTPELELEANFVWLQTKRTGGWIGSHFDIVDKFSAAERPTDRRAYTHKLNFELDTSLAVFNWLPEDHWLRGVEVEGSLDYVATGLPKAGDRRESVRFLDKASPWSFSIVFVLPLAPL